MKARSSTQDVAKSVFSLEISAPQFCRVQTAPEQEDLIYEVETEIANALAEHTDDIWALH